MTDLRLGGVVLAAGAGTRLRPVTDARPKPLTSVLGVTLLDRALNALHALGVRRTFVNTYTDADAIAEHVRSRGSWVHVRKETRLSGPAGALRLFREELTGTDAVVIVSGDALFNDPLVDLLAAHRRHDADLTFGVVRVTDAGRFGVLDVDDDGLLIEAKEKPNVPASEEHLVSAGIYVLRPGAVEALPDDDVVDYVTHLVPGLMARGRTVATHQLTQGWFDVGSPAELHAATHRALSAQGLTRFIAPTAHVAPDAVLEGWVSIEDGACVGAGAWVQDAVVMRGGQVPAGSYLCGGVVGARGGGNAPEDARE